MIKHMMALFWALMLTLGFLPALVLTTFFQNPFQMYHDFIGKDTTYETPWWISWCEFCAEKARSHFE